MLTWHKETVNLGSILQTQGFYSKSPRKTTNLESLASISTLILLHRKPTVRKKSGRKLLKN